jgi:hypothetical protein
MNKRKERPSITLIQIVLSRYYNFPKHKQNLNYLKQKWLGLYIWEVTSIYFRHTLYKWERDRACAVASHDSLYLVRFISDHLVLVLVFPAWLMTCTLIEIDNLANCEVRIVLSTSFTLKIRVLWNSILTYALFTAKDNQRRNYKTILQSVER